MSLKSTPVCALVHPCDATLGLLRASPHACVPPPLGTPLGTPPLGAPPPFSTPSLLNTPPPGTPPLGGPLPLGSPPL
ncbi:hypothetical protein FRC08_012174, partial [Ceratobasidium sp. 394]